MFPKNGAMMRYGYARVSSKTQDYSVQVDALNAAGCERIFSEKRSGKSAKDRPEFSKLMRALVPGDTVVVNKLDRLARSSRDLHNILHELQERECGFVSLGESWCDSTSEVGRLMLTIMGGIADFERDLIRKRCEEGIERAKANGKQFGRPSAFGCLSLSQTPSSWRLIENRAMLLLDVRFVQTDLWNGDRPSAVARCARGRNSGLAASNQCAAAN